MLGSGGLCRWPVVAECCVDRHFFSLSLSPFQNQVKGLEVLHDLGQLVNATTATQRELRQECAFALLQLLYEKASALIRQLQNFGWQVRSTEVG